VLVLRLGSLSGDEDEVETDPAPGILVPCAGGQHSRLGMKLAAKIVGEETMALYVESDVDDLSKDVGYEHLRRTLKRAGVAPDSVSSKVVLSEKVSDAISRELNDGDYGLMLIGAAGGGTLRRKLFGTVPQRLMQGSEGMSIGVIRAARRLAIALALVGIGMSVPLASVLVSRASRWCPLNNRCGINLIWSTTNCSVPNYQENQEVDGNWTFISKDLSSPVRVSSLLCGSLQRIGMAMM